MCVENRLQRNMGTSREANSEASVIGAGRSRKVRCEN